MQRTIPLPDLPSAIEILKADGSFLLSNEFHNLHAVSLDYYATCPKIVSELVENQDKNRYCNILPCTYYT